MSGYFSVDKYAEAIAAAAEQSRQNPDCSIHLTVTIKSYPASELRMPEITGFRISDWYDESVIHTFVNGVSVGG